jgi:hypothetical protein
MVEYLSGLSTDLGATSNFMGCAVSSNGLVRQFARTNT